jgi:hypothetical protein
MQIGATTTREQRLAWRPQDAIELLRRPGPDERSTVALAMAEQLGAAGVPFDALEMCLMFWSRALDGLPPGVVPPERLARLDSDLADECRDLPALGAWLAELRRHVITAHDLDYVIRFLMQVRQSWVVTAQPRS